MSDLNSLIIFAHVVDANGFSKAARRLKMPTSTVSRRIAELEQALGVRLIESSTRSLRLTDVGSEVLEYAHRGAEIREAIDNKVIRVGPLPFTGGLIMIRVVVRPKAFVGLLKRHEGVDYFDIGTNFNPLHL
jgi:DNA-binding transcriptional LysR family regulator